MPKIKIKCELCKNSNTLTLKKEEVAAKCPSCYRRIRLLPKKVNQLAKKKKKKKTDESKRIQDE